VFVLFTSLFIAWLHLADHLEVGDGVLKLMLHCITMTATEIALHVGGIELYSFAAVKDAQTIVFHLQMGLSPIAVIDGLLLG